MKISGLENKSYSVVYRIMHWAIALTFLLLLATIFLRLTWLNKYNVAEIIQNYLSETDQFLSEDQLIVLAKKIREPMWNWHIYLGYVLLGLFSIRFVLPAFGQMQFQNPLRKNLTTKSKIQRWAYLILYGCVVVSLITGLIIEWGPKTLKKSMESIHEWGIYYLVAFILVHLGGVLYAEFSGHQGLISKIVSGSSEGEG